MLIPSIDIMNGQAVQLIGGRELAVEAGDPRPLADRFGRLGDIAVVDLDAALGRGSNEAIILELLDRAPCRVGGGIRSVERALRWLDAGAAQVVLGTAATPELLSQLPRERVVAALDAVHGQVVVEGWRTATGRRVEERMDALREYVSNFLVTFVEREGRMAGIDFEVVEQLVEAAAGARLTIAGGVTTAKDVARLDRLGAEAQVGMALYTGRLDPADCVYATARCDRPDGLLPTVVVDEHGRALGLVWSSRESLRAALSSGRGVYHSRSRGGLWIKGETSGDSQKLLRIDLDCDRDALRFTVSQSGRGFCHAPAPTCWGADGGLGALERRLRARVNDAPTGSYTSRLVREPALLAAKILEEARELTQAQGTNEAVHEAADVLYFTLVDLARRGVTLAQVATELDRRALRVTRRPGNAKPTPREACRVEDAQS